MGLFSRKNSKPIDHSDRNPSPHSNGNVKAPFAMKRANGNPGQNASIPNIPLPRAPDPNLDPAGYLRSIYAVRERSRLVLEKARKNQLRHFTVDMTKFADTAAYVVSVIKVSRETLPRHAVEDAHG